jgi:outer membrane protein
MDFRIKGRLLVVMVILPLMTMFALGFATQVFSEDLKIGYINSQRIIDESKAGKSTTMKMEEFKRESTTKLEQKNKEIEDLQQELRKKEFAITPEKKKELEEKIRDKSLELKFFKESKEKELKELFYGNLKGIENDVLNIVQQIGQDEGFDLILGRDESGILYANPKFDITEKVIRIYDQQIQK